MSTRLHCNRKFRISVTWNDESFQRVGFCWSKRQQDSFLYGTCVGLPISIGPVDETKLGDTDKGQDFKGRWAVPHRLEEELFRFWVRRTGTHTSMFRGECTRGTGTMCKYLWNESRPYGMIQRNRYGSLGSLVVPSDAKLKGAVLWAYANKAEHPKDAT